MRRRLEEQFQTDFTQVRLHTDDAADRSARAHGALAYSVGTDIFFGRGQYAPRTAAGARLLAHELVHVVQQSAAGGGLPGPAHEHEADDLAQRSLLGERLTASLATQAGVPQFQADPQQAGAGAAGQGVEQPLPVVAADVATSQATMVPVSAPTDDDLAKATEHQRIDMIHVALDAGDGDALPRLWDSFGAGLQAAATSHAAEWTRTMDQHADVMRLNSREVRGLEAAFVDDIRQVAWAYLRANDQVVLAEMQKLGIPAKEGDVAQATDAQNEELRRTQADAGKLAEAQAKREELRKTEIAFHRRSVKRGGTELPEGGVENVEQIEEPVFFDPDHRFDAASQPTDYVPGLMTWEEAYSEYVELTNVIKAYFIVHPSLYALSRSADTGAEASGTATASAEQARQTLGAQLRTVRENIAKTRDLVPALAPQMTQIQSQLLSGTVGAPITLKQDWSQPFLHSLGQDVVAQQQPGPWWLQLGLTGLEAAAYVVTGLATAGIGPVLLAGGQAAISIGQYQALEAASRANVTPDTVLIQGGQVVAAAVEAVIAVAVSFLTALQAARALRAAAPGAPGELPPHPGPAAGDPEGKGRWFNKPTVTGDPTLPKGWGRTDKFGNIRYSTQGTIKDQQLALMHEKVHSILSPKLIVLLNFRADVGMTAYLRSSLLKYLEEAMAETYAQLKVNGISGLPTGITFPVKEGYVKLWSLAPVPKTPPLPLAVEGAIGTVAVGGYTYAVYVVATKPITPPPSPPPPPPPPPSPPPTSG